MRPLRLDLAGFTVFREPATIDFTDADYFALVGPTGSGKSTILDAICFALYGTVPRWGERRSIGNALAPSATEARVRLVFETAGERYVLTRVLRRDGKGTVSTKHAGLEALPPGFDLATFDRSPAGSPRGGRTASATDLGRVLAGTPGEVDEAIGEVIGLPYEQFTKCVVLPQGEFAAFLHARPAERQRILVNLLGLEVYGRVRERASAVAATAEAKITAFDQALAERADATVEAVAAAEARVAALTTLADQVDRVLPELAAARAARAGAVAALATLDSEITRLSQVAVPAEVGRTAAAVAEAAATLRAASEAMTSAEERDDKARAEHSAAGDAAQLRQLLDGHATVAQLTGEAAAADEAVAAATGTRDLAAADFDHAAERAAVARKDLAAAYLAYETAVATDRAAALRQHLHLGEPCPVCDQVVTALPTALGGQAAAAAKAAGQAAKKAVEAADALVARLDRASRTADLALARARDRADELTARRAAATARLAGAPAPETLQAQLRRIAGLDSELAGAGDRLAAARTAHRRAMLGWTTANERLRGAWQVFDQVRDALAGLCPPAVDRDDLAAAWAELGRWAGAEAAGRQVARGAAADAVSQAERAATAVAGQVSELFRQAGVGYAAADDDPARVAAVAAERARGEYRRLSERRSEAERLRDQRAAAATAAQLARGLATQLRADRFERWLLAEALGALVEGASRILRELTSGQYDLGHDKGEFFIVDHHDAGLRRAVRTLSGGETFQAALALALALSEQLAGVTAATTSLESILLDEGFGTLDTATLDVVAATLENLAARGDRMVGVVTHVPGLAERIPVRFEVRRDARTARVERAGL